MRLILRGIVTFSVLILFAVACRDDSGLVSETPAVPLSPADNLYQMAEKFREDAKYDSAIVLYEAAKALYREDGDKVRLVTCMNHVGDCLRRKGKYDDAWAHLDSTLSLGKRYFGEQDTVVAKTYHHMGAVKWRISDYDSSIILYLRALEINLPEFGEQHLDVAYTYNNLGVAYQSRGDAMVALSYHEKSLEIRQKLLGENELVAQSLNNLGIVYRVLGDYDNSRMYYERSLALTIKTSGLNDFETARAHNNLGIINTKIGDFFKAIVHLEQALSIKTQLLGTDHYEVAVNLNNLAVPLRRIGKPAEAVRRIEQAVEIVTRIFGAEYYFLGFCHHNLALAYADLKEVSKSILHHQIAVRILTEALGAIHPRLIEAYKKLGDSYLLVNDWKNFDSCYQKALKISVANFGDKHPEVADAYLGLGRAAKEQGHWELALDYCEKALTACLSRNRMDLTQTEEKLPPMINVGDGLVLLECLIVKGSVFKQMFEGKKENRTNYLDLAIEQYSSAVSLIDSIRSSYRIENSKILFGEGYLNVYEKAIELALQKSQSSGASRFLEVALSFSERSKSVVLFESTAKFAARTSGCLPDSIIRLERRLRLELSFLDRKLFSSDKTDRFEFADLRNRRLELLGSYGQTTDFIESHCPDYHKLSHFDSGIGSRDSESVLVDSLGFDFVLEYFFGVENAYLFSLSREGLNVSRIGKTKVLDNLAIAVRALFDKEGVQSGDPIETLRRLIFPKDKLPEIVGRVLIIPDGYLSLVPLDLVFFGSDDFSRSQTSFSYDYSCGFALRRNEPGKQHGLFFALAGE